MFQTGCASHAREEQAPSFRMGVVPSARGAWSGTARTRRESRPSLRRSTGTSHIAHRPSPLRDKGRRRSDMICRCALTGKRSSRGQRLPLPAIARIWSPPLLIWPGYPPQRTSPALLRPPPSSGPTSSSRLREASDGFDERHVFILAPTCMLERDCRCRGISKYVAPVCVLVLAPTAKEASGSPTGSSRA